MNYTISTFRRGIVIEPEDGAGVLRELTPGGAAMAVDIRFAYCDVRFLDIDAVRRNLSYGPKMQSLEDGYSRRVMRDPVVGDFVRFDCKYDGVLQGLVATAWTYEVHYKECEDKLPRCVVKECNNPPRLRKHCCTFHAPREDDIDPYADDDDDPLAGAVDPTSGYPEPQLHPHDAHRLEVMRQHGDYTG